MNARGLGIAFFLFGTGFVFAGEGSPHEQAIQRMLGCLDGIGKTLKSIDSEETAASAKTDLRKAAKDWVEIRSKAAKMPPPERAEKDRLAKMYRPKIDDALKIIFTEIRRVEVFPGGKDTLKELHSVVTKDEK